MQSVDKLKEMFTEFPYELFNVILTNKSFVDIMRLDVDSYEEGHDYIKNYGFDLDNSFHSEQVFNILNEAKQFIQTYLLEDPENITPVLTIPPYIQCEDDIRNILVMASNKERDLKQRWACALLRVAHTITHVENDLAKYFFQGIKKQIFSRFMQHLTVNTNGEYILGRGRKKVKLKLFEMKSEKTKESMIMKLLHKKESVTADIFDRVGVRIITNDKLDVLIVLKYLAETHVISFANVKPSRTRNNLISIDNFLEGIEKLKSLDISDWSEEDVRNFLKKFTVFEKEEQEDTTDRIIKENNPYSSTMYTSIQITVRHLITIQDPFNINLTYKFFFPFEIQILDKDSYEESRHGRASHDEYKKNQTVAVRRRVLGNVLSFHERYGLRKKNASAGLAITE